MSKMKIYSEPVKQQHVTHWDRDYLPTSYLDALCPELQSKRFPRTTSLH